ncbi:helix-turn-helix domain-containing protein [Nocardioides sp. Root151]|uniref:helix-turn-helix domain-containing protein n=1 Tax=Nocardioides sp. Root151 TaxID=1736475 RepID=UPI0009ECA0B1|nr:helix-turn-helix domain-containing protein [Nocardioides sp. Root151]
MPLSRGEGPIRVVGQDDPSPVDAAPVVLAIAASAQDRLRIAEAIGTSAAVVMVATRAEALEILGGLPAVEPALRSVPPVPPQALPMRPAHAPSRPAPALFGLEVDSDWRVASWQDREVGLSPLEHDLLLCLLEEVGHVQPFADLQRRVWGNDHLGDRSHVQSVVKRLRRKLHELDSPLQIDAVRGVGLRLIDVRQHRTPEAAVVPGPRAPTGTSLS